MSGSLFPKTITVKRYPGSYVDGNFTPGEEQVFTIQASVQPITGKDVDPRQVGRTDTGQVKIYTDVQLHVSEEGGGFKDFIVWDGREWEVMKRRAHDGGLLPHVHYEAEYRKPAV